MKFLSFAVLLVVASPLFAQQNDAQAAAEILQTTKLFWIDLNLGDLEKLPAVIRPEDVLQIPTPSGDEAVGMMKMKDLPQFDGIRKEIIDKLPAAFAFSQPVFTADGKSASVTVSPVASGAQSFFESKAVYQFYLLKVYQAKQTGHEIPPLESVKTYVLGPNSPQIKSIEVRVAAFDKATLPSLQIDKTDQGWRVNLPIFLGRKP